MNFCKVKDENIIIYNPQKQFSETMDKLKPGIYTTFDAGGMFQTILAFEPVKLKEKLIRFHSGAVGECVNVMEKFFLPGTRKKYEEMGMEHKTGVILYGPPGTGKTCSCQLIMAEAVEKYDAICLDATGRSITWAIKVISTLRTIQDNPIILFQDEVENNFEKEENSYLTFLDGNNSFSNLMFLGCTNFLNKIPRRIRERRSRIKKCLEIKSLPLEIYKEYIENKAPKLPAKIISEFAYKASEACLVMDELKHALIDVVIDDIPINKAIAEVKAYSKQDKW